MSQKKAFGGLGVLNLRDFNMALLASWAKRFCMGGDKNWITLVNYKYNTCKPNVFWSKTDIGSYFWKGVTWAFVGSGLFINGLLGTVVALTFGMISGLEI